MYGYGRSVDYKSNFLAPEERSLKSKNILVYTISDFYVKHLKLFEWEGVKSLFIYKMKISEKLVVVCNPDKSR